MVKGLTILLCLLFVCRLQGQESDQKSDTLIDLDYNELLDKIYSVYNTDKNLAFSYSKTYLTKARKDKDSLQVAKGYISLGMTAWEYPTAMIYMDSLINYTKDFNTQKYPALAYSTKSDIQYGYNKYKEALDNAIKANDILKKWPSNEQTYAVKYQIAILRAIIGEHEQALQYYNVSKDFFKENSPNYYEFTLFGLCESHMALKHLDSTAYYAKLGMKYTKEQNSQSQVYFTYIFGEMAYHQGDYLNAIDSLSKSSLGFIKTNDLANLAQNEYWLGVSKERIGEAKSAILHYKKVDSLFDIGQKINLRYRGAWEKLINFYHQKGNLESELYYTKKLMKYDSIVSDDYKYLSSNIVAKYDIPELINKKEEAILAYKKNQRKGYIALIVITGLFLTGALGFFLYRKHELKKVESYKKIIERLENPQRPIKQKETKSLNFAPELELKIKEGLNKFENKEGYLQPNVTVGGIAKKIGTNRKYLSQYVNHVKEVKFPDYINALRIDYALRRFHTNEGNFKIWRMNAIAKELGFSSREYYTKAFQKHTKIKPNEYLENLMKDEKKHRNS